MPRTLDRLLPSATAWISTTAVHPCYTPSNDTSADEVTLIAAHFHDSDKNSDVLVHDMAFSYPRWVLKDAS